MTYFVGIDPASEAFVAAVFRDPEGPEAGPRSFSNDPDGIASFQGWLDENELDQDETIICVENTGVYSEVLCYELERQGFRLTLLNPHAVWKAFKSDRKTDELDSQKIAEYGYRYRDKLVLWEPHEVVVEQVKTLLSTREQLVQQKTASLNARQALSRKAIQTPPANDALEKTIGSLAEQIKAIEAAIQALIEEHPTMAQMMAIVASAPGVGDLLAAHMLVLTKGFTEEPSYRQLASYLGICPNEQQSGTWRKKPTSRRYGPAIMRKLLHLAARSVRTHKERFRAYFHRKREEGKPKSLVINNIANKLLRILCGMIKNKQPYIENHQSVHPRLIRDETRS